MRTTFLTRRGFNRKLWDSLRKYLTEQGMLTDNNNPVSREFGTYNLFGSPDMCNEKIWVTERIDMDGKDAVKTIMEVRIIKRRILDY